MAFSWGDDISGDTLGMLNGHPYPVTAEKMIEFIYLVCTKCGTSIPSVSQGETIDRSASGSLAKCCQALGVTYTETSWGYKSFWQTLENKINEL